MHYKNILLIDDDEDDQEIFLSAVATVSKDATCMTLSNAEEALEKLVAREIFPEVIFLDLNMPIMNGQQFLTLIKQQDVLKSIPVIIFSTSSHTPTMEIVKELGATDYIVKPENFTDFIAILSPIIG
jgi:CheY-like chemotaxis protein